MNARNNQGETGSFVSRSGVLLAVLGVVLAAGCSSSDDDGSKDDDSTTKDGGAKGDGGSSNGGATTGNGGTADAGGAGGRATGGVAASSGGASADAGESCEGKDPVVMGSPCSKDDDCGCPAYCAVQPGQTTGYCSKTGCKEDASVCPTDWGCLDLSMFQAGLPSVCTQPPSP